MLTTHTITLPTPEQRAVYAACEDRFHFVRGHHWRPNDPALHLTVQDGSHHPMSMVVAPNGTTRESTQGLVPTALYGPLPKRKDARREWGRGIPPYAVKHMPTPSDDDTYGQYNRDGSPKAALRKVLPTPSDDSGDEAMCECGAGEHESCRCATREQHGTSYHVREA